MPVSSEHVEYASALMRWERTRHAVEGQDAIKNNAKRNKYLLEFEDKDDKRFKKYLNLAYYVNVTGRTHNGLLGAVFRKDPSIEVPTVLQYIEEDADGCGQSIAQVAKQVTSYNLIEGRFGLLADYPQAEEGLSAEDVRSRDLKASIKVYAPKSIINWKTTTRNGKSILSMVVLKESVEEAIDEFESKCVDQYRVLRLNDNVYTHQLYDEYGEPKGEEITPRMPSGSSWDVIPFAFGGADDNTPRVGSSPLYDMANINIAHFRNVADNEAALRVFSQCSLHVDTGEMSADTWGQLNPNGVAFGSESAIVTNGGGSVRLIQAAPHDKCTQAIKDKEDQMVAVGARLISKVGINKTAEEARINASSEMSVLETVVGNVSEAIEQALEYCAMFMGADPESVNFALNTEFFDTKFTAQEIMAAIQLADRGDIAQSDLREILRKSDWLSEARTDDEIDGEVEITPPLASVQPSPANSEV